MNQWKTNSKQTVYSSGKWLIVEERSVETPSGETIDHWNWVITPDYVNVLAETEDGQFLIFRQGKYALEGESLAPMGGYIEPDEDPLSAAKRELMEETGCEAREWLFLGEYQVDPNRGICKGSFYLARGAVKVAQASGGDLEEQHLMLVSRADLLAGLAQGKVKVMAWAAIIALALLLPG